MNPLLVCAYKLRKLRPATGKLGVHIVADEKLVESDCRRMLAAWDWVAVLSFGKTPPVVGPHEVLLAAVADYTPLEKAFGERCLTPEFAPVGTLDNDFTREVSFFDFEVSGKNE